MQEQRRPSLQPTGAGSGAAGIWDDAGAEPGLATVAHGPYAEQLPVARMSVADVRARFGDRLDIDPGAVALLDGREAGEGDRVEPGQYLMFVRRAGEKGGAP